MVREDTDKFIEVVDGHHVTTNQKVTVGIQMCDDNGNTIVATLYNVLLASDLCDRLFSIITLMNAGYNFFSKRVLHGILLSREEKCGNITTQCTKETYISRKNQGYVKEKQITSKK